MGRRNMGVGFLDGGFFHFCNKTIQRGYIYYQVLNGIEMRKYLTLTATCHLISRSGALTRHQLRQVPLGKRTQNSGTKIKFIKVQYHVKRFVETQTPRLFPDLMIHIYLPSFGSNKSSPQKIE
ncbi:hypothetical protein V6Z12_D11G216100 [Gossypium hirsutum]